VIQYKKQYVQHRVNAWCYVCSNGVHATTGIQAYGLSLKLIALLHSLCSIWLGWQASCQAVMHRLNAQAASHKAKPTLQKLVKYKRCSKNRRKMDQPSYLLKRILIIKQLTEDFTFNIS